MGMGEAAQRPWAESVTHTLHLAYEQWAPLVDSEVASSVLDEQGHILHPRLAAVLEQAGFVASEPVECEVLDGAELPAEGGEVAIDASSGAKERINNHL